MPRHAAHQRDIRHRCKHAEAVDPSCHPDRQAFPDKLVDQGHQPELAPVISLRLNEVEAPNMIAMLRPQPDAGSIVEPEPASRPLLPRCFQLLPAPDPLDPITTDLPAVTGKQRCNPAIAVSMVLG